MKFRLIKNSNINFRSYRASQWITRLHDFTRKPAKDGLFAVVLQNQRYAILSSSNNPEDSLLFVPLFLCPFLPYYLINKFIDS